jgi:hypothetical protein
VAPSTGELVLVGGLRGAVCRLAMAPPSLSCFRYTLKAAGLMATPHPYRGLTLSLQAKQHGEALTCLHNANHMRKQRTVNPSKGNTLLFLEFSHKLGPGKRSKALAARLPAGQLSDRSGRSSGFGALKVALPSPREDADTRRRIC